MKEFQIPDTNIVITKKGYDTNGNTSLFGYILPNVRFKVQLNNPELYNTKYALGSARNLRDIQDVFDDLSPRESKTIAKELVDYIRNYGSGKSASAVKSWFRESYNRLFENSNRNFALKLYNAFQNMLPTVTGRFARNKPRKVLLRGDVLIIDMGTFTFELTVDAVKYDKSIDRPSQVNLLFWVDDDFNFYKKYNVYRDGRGVGSDYLEDIVVTKVITEVIPEVVV